MSYPNQTPNKLPREIYMRRRVAAFLVIVVVVLGLLWAFSALGGNGGSSSTNSAQQTTGEVATPADAAAQQSSSVVTATETTSAESAVEDSAQASASAAPGADIDPALADKKTCELSDLVITASSDHTTYPTGVQPNFGMTVTNPTGADCQIDLDKETLRFEVYSIADNSRIWSDIDCYPAVQTGTYTFPAGEQRSFAALWSRLRSNDNGRCSNRAPAEPGSYFLHTVIGNNASEPYTFNLQ
ncbi:MAG: hypothetical protein SOW59_01075 [Corynebacterium sp.]|nr:hypothetical protein [Corynebacterium sp.]